MRGCDARWRTSRRRSPRKVPDRQRVPGAMRVGPASRAGPGFPAPLGSRGLLPEPILNATAYSRRAVVVHRLPLQLPREGAEQVAALRLVALHALLARAQRTQHA